MISLTPPLSRLLAGTCFAAMTLMPLMAQAPLPVPAPAPPGAGTAADPGTIQLQFPNNGISEILGIYEMLTGKAVVKDSGIFDGKPISLVTARPVTTAEAVELIESTLQLNGYVMSHTPGGKSVRVALQTADQSNLSRGLDILLQPSELPVGHTMASYFLKLQHLNPAETAATLWSHLGLNKFGRLTPVTSPPGLLITENADNIRQILRVVSVLDVSQDQTHLRTEFYPLQFADAVVVGQILTSTFTQRQTPPPLTKETVGDSATRLPRQPPAPPTARVVSDDRLNRIMLVADDADHVYAQKLIKQFDQPIETAVPLERRLKYVFVDQVLPVLVDVLQDAGTGSSTLAGGEVVRTRRLPVASSDPSTLAGRPRRIQTAREGAATAPEGYEDQLATPEENAAPLSVLIGKTRLVADVQANKLIAYGPPEDLLKITGLLDRLDHKPPQVYLATIIGQLSLDDGIEFGIDYLRQFRAGDRGDVAGALVSWDTLTRAVGDIRNPIAAAPLNPISGLNIYGQINDGLDVFLRALETSRRFKILSRPSIYAANNKKAVITSGRRIPVPTSSVTDLSNTNSVRTNIDFQDVVLKLEVIPLINSNREVSLTIAQVNDTVVGQQQISGDSVPIIGTERLLTAVTVANRSTVVLGGLITETEEKSTSGVPVISRIPVLGHAFKSTKTNKSRKELIIFIQPVVVEDPEEVTATSLGEDLRTGIGADAAQIFPDLSPALPSFERPLPASAPKR